MINHIVELCPLNKLVDNGLLQLHSADDNTVRDMTMEELVK